MRILHVVTNSTHSAKAAWSMASCGATLTKLAIAYSLTIALTFKSGPLLDVLAGCLQRFSAVHGVAKFRREHLIYGCRDQKIPNNLVFKLQLHQFKSEKCRYLTSGSREEVIGKLVQKITRSANSQLCPKSW